MSEDKLKRALAQAHRPDLLAEIAAVSRDAFGFFTKHYPHTINYSWLLERLEGLRAGSTVFDVGAGVSPLPLILARRGLHVDCIDGSKVIRTLPASADWNEWGFLNYGERDSRIRAWNCTVSEFTPKDLYDRVYSISVIAHMHRSDRDCALRRMRTWLRSGGRMLLAIDLMPSSDFIWNRSEGRELEAPEVHGTIWELRAKLLSLDMRLTEFRVIRGVHESRTDLLFVECMSPYK
jgi:SAM-dependent methyltransferase